MPKTFISLLVSSCMLIACASTYQPPAETNPNRAKISFLLDEEIEQQVRITLFKGLNCEAFPNGGFAGSLHQGTLLSDPIEQFDTQVGTGGYLTIELHERKHFGEDNFEPSNDNPDTPEVCISHFSFEPQAAASYLVVYRDCDFTLTDTASNTPVATQKPTGDCKPESFLKGFSIRDYVDIGGDDDED